MLETVRVLDLTQLLPGPYATLLLAELGAQVIKVEPPQGDPLRALPPFLPDGRSARFEALNRGKRGVTLDLKREGERGRFLQLARTADAVVEGFRPGVVKRLGVDYEAVRKVKPDVVYCSISGYGQAGPGREQVGHDLNYLARAGVLSMTGLASPQIPGVPVADLAGGTLAALSMLAALWQRARTGGGQFLDVSLAAAAFHWTILHLAEYAATGRTPTPDRMPLCGAYPFYALYETQEGGWLSVGCLEPKFWENLCRALGREELIPLQFAEGHERERVFSTLRDTFRARPLEHWLAVLDPGLIPVAPLQDVAQAVRDERFAALARGLPGLPFPVRWDGRPARPPADAPALGQHNAALFAQAGNDRRPSA